MNEQPTPTQRVDIFARELGIALASNRRDCAKQVQEFNTLIEHHLKPLATELERVQDENKTLRGMAEVGTKALIERDDLRRQLEELETQLRIIGDKAVVDWDNETVGQVDAVVKTQPPQTYIEFVRKLYTRSEEIDTLRRQAEELKKVAAINEMYARDAEPCIKQLRAENAELRKCCDGMAKYINDIKEFWPASYNALPHVKSQAIDAAKVK